MSTSFLQWQSLRTRVVLLTLAIFLIGIWAFYLYAAFGLRGHMMRALRAQQEAVVSVADAAINARLADRLTVLQQTAKAVSPLLSSPKALQKALDTQILLPLQFNGGVVVTDAFGTSIARVPFAHGSIGINYRKDAWISAALKDGKSSIGRPLVGKLLHAPVFAMTVPVRDPRGKVIGTLSGVIDLDKPNFLDDIVQNRYGRGGEIWLVAPQYGLIVTASNKQRVMEQFPATDINPAHGRRFELDDGTVTNIDRAGRKWLITRKVVPAAGWRVAAALPASEAFASILEMQHRTLLAAIVLTLLAGALAKWMLDYQLAPMRAVAKTLDAVRDGTHQLQPLSIARRDEVGKLIAAFNRLLQSLSQRELSLQKSEARFSTLIEWSPEALAVHRGGKWIYVNPAAIRMFGAASAQDLVGKSIFDRIHPSFLEIVKARAQAVVQEHVSVPLIEGKYLKLDGTAIDVEVQATPIEYDGEDAVQVAMRDITGRKRAEDALLRESRRNEIFLRNASDGVHILDAEGKVLEASDSFCEMLGYARSELIGATPSLWDAHWSAEELKQVISRQMDATGRSVFETRHRRRDGSIFDVEVSGQPLELNGQRVLFNSSRDITARKRSEAAMRESEERFSTVFHASPIGITINRMADGKLVEANDAALRMYGYKRDQAIGRTSIQLGTYADPEQRTQLVETLRAHGQVEGFEVPFRRRSGEAGIIALSARAAIVDGEVCIIAMLVDATERHRLAHLHLQAQKLESLGTLTGGIAHDFNNILTAIRGNAGLAAEDVGPEHLAAESLAEIRKASDRAIELVRRITAFARPKENRLEVVDLGPVVQEVLKLLRPTLPAGISLRTQFDGHTPLTLADAGQVHEVLVNLTTNAAYAIGRSAGSIQYRLEPVQVGEGGVRPAPGLTPGCYARLTVSDSGCGMDTTTMERIFDVFYTTKPIGEGTGLGLSMVHGIVKSHGGAITVESEPGKGSSFALYFPSAPDRAVEKDDSVGAPLRLSGGRRVLYVDDEEALVSLASRALSRAGHKVAGFTSPEKALGVFRANPKDFDVLVTDLSMPQMSGFELARAFHAIRPDIPVAMTTGHLLAEDELRARDAGVQEFILKPFTSVDEFTRALERLFRRCEPNGQPSARTGKLEPE